jgi:hypothetical protein
MRTPYLRDEMDYGYITKSIDVMVMKEALVKSMPKMQVDEPLLHVIVSK